MEKRSAHGGSRFEVIGWITFVASACFFIAASARSGDLLGLAGAVLFLLACFVFLVPLVRGRAAPPCGGKDPGSGKD